MPKAFFKKYLPSPHRMRQEKSLRILGDWLHDPNLWHLNRHSVAGAAAIGLFLAFVPFPFGQTFAAALLAVYFRVNLPLAALLVWITNPITMPPVYLMQYKLGQWVMGLPSGDLNFELSLEWLSSQFILVWKPLLVGGLITSTLAAILGYFGIHAFWRWSVMKRFEKRRQNKIKKRQSSAGL